MIFDLYEAHQVMKNPNYTLDEKVEELEKLGLSFEQASDFLATYIFAHPYTPFKLIYSDDDE